MREHGSSGTDDRPLLVIAGRSNVGKSSVVRLLTGRRVRVGKRAGSTRWTAFIDLGSVVLADMPGFGHAERLSKTAIEEAKKRIVRDLEEWGNRVVVAVLVLDLSLFEEIVNRWEARREIPIDVEFYSFLSEITKHVIIVANKSDKVRRAELTSAIDYVKVKMLQAVPDRQTRIIVFSAAEHTGLHELKEEIENLICSVGLSSPSW